MRGRKPYVRDPKAGRPSPLPRCPPHLTEVARNEWRRLARPLHEMGVLTTADRAAFAAYCQAYARWVEAEEKLQETPPLLKTPSGYVQQSPWLSISNKQLELMGRFMGELGLTPSARARLQLPESSEPRKIELVTVFVEPDGTRHERRIEQGISGRDGRALRSSSVTLESDAETL